MLWRNAFRANLRKAAIELRRYWPNTLSTLVTFYLVFLLLHLGMELVGDPTSSPAHGQTLIAVMVLWLLALMAMHGIGAEVSAEASRGTLEQLYMSPLGAWKILLARMLATVAINSILIAAMLVLSMLTLGRWLTLDVLTLGALLVVTVAGMLGVGFMLAGLALVFKQIQSLLRVAQFLALLLVSLPISLSPWLELAPVVRGASMLRAAMTDGVRLFGFAGADWALLIGNAALYLALGLSAYRLAERRAMRLGLLGQY